MKITYTKQEAIEYIKQSLGNTLGLSLTVEIIDNTDWYDRVFTHLDAAKCLDQYGNIKPDMKIAAIKALRTFTSDNQKELGREMAYGLAEAKWAIENWNKFLDFARVRKTLPTTIHENGVMS